MIAREKTKEGKFKQQVILYCLINQKNFHRRDAEISPRSSAKTQRPGGEKL